MYEEYVQLLIRKRILKEFCKNLKSATIQTFIRQKCVVTQKILLKSFGSSFTFRLSKWLHEFQSTISNTCWSNEVKVHVLVMWENVWKRAAC